MRSSAGCARSTQPNPGWRHEREDDTSPPPRAAGYPWLPWRRRSVTDDMFGERATPLLSAVSA
jgi:hypothetical protein